MTTFGRAAALALLVAFGAVPALACSPVPPTDPPQQALDKALDRATLVIHARVLAQEGSVDGTNRTLMPPVKLHILRIFKGSVGNLRFYTINSAACGMGDLPIGREYVFFFNYADNGELHAFGRLTTAEILAALEPKLKK